jgi:hypothetical protein
MLLLDDTGKPYANTEILGEEGINGVLTCFYKGNPIAIIHDYKVIPWQGEDVLKRIASLRARYE